jgi:hypothetical protein
MAANVGECVRNIVTKIMNQSKYPEQGFKSCIGIIQLSKKYGNNKVNKACNKALFYKSFQYTFIKNILLNNQEEMEEQPSLFPDLVHENIRGSAYYS